MAKTNRRHTFRITKDVYRETTRKDGSVRSKLIKKNVTLEIDLWINDIIGVGHIIDNNGNIQEDKCEIYHREKGEFIVDGSKVEISTLVFGEEYDDSKIGFKSK